MFALAPLPGIGQACPPNLDAEYGDFTNWQCYTGTVAAIGNANVISISPSAPATGQHLMYSNQTAIRDEYGGFPQACPNGSGYSIKLGNNAGGKFSESISYSFAIPATDNEYSLSYWYAVVFQNPDHSDFQQPRFVATIYDETDGDSITCASFTYVGSSGLPGFQQSSANREVVFKPWSQVTVNLNGLAGHRIRLQFTTADCTQGGHFGYAYIDINSKCSQPVEGAAYCRGAASVGLNAPFGFQQYTWLDMNGQVLGISQALTLSPPPSDGTILSVALQPYPGFGCIDTLHTVIKEVIPPTADAGPDTTFCAGSAVQIGMQGNSSWQYQWSPAGGLSNPSGSVTLANPSAATIYHLYVTDSTGGCTTADSVLVAPVVPDTTLTASGDTAACQPQSVQVWLQLAAKAGVQWYKDGEAADGATAPDYLATSPGVYYAVLSEKGCTTRTRSVMLRNPPTPSAVFVMTTLSPCLPNNEVSVQTASSGSSRWLWGDGRENNDSLATHTYRSAGEYTIRHILTSAAGCADTSDQDIAILPTPQAYFSVSGSCTGLPATFTNQTAYSGSSSVSYRWIFPGGDTVFDARTMHVFESTGTYTVKLDAFSADCPGNVSAISKRITITPLPKGQHTSINAVLNQPTRLSAATDGSSHAWMPPVFLDNSQVAQPLFTGTQSTQYQVDLMNASGCPLTDTVDVRVFREADIWVPSAFTPNRDGKNDLLYPITAGMERLIVFRVWNRWGQLVFETSQAGKGWNGTLGGRPQASGNFVWMAEALGVSGNRVFRKGNTVLIR